MGARGFVLTPTYRVVEGRPQVHLYAVLDDGQPALVVDDRFRPYFFVRAADAAALAAAAPEARVTPTELTTFAGEPVVRVEVNVPPDVPPVRARLAALGVPTYEADVRFAIRYLIDHGIRGSFAVEGVWTARPGVGRVYHNPRLEPAEFAPTLRVLSFDVETSPDGRRLYSLAVAGAGGERVFLVGRRPVAGAEVVPDERACLEAFLAHLRAADPDVLTGWNVGDFDIPVLLAVARRVGVRLALGRTEEEVEVRRDAGFTREPRVTATGRQVLDGLALVRSAFIRLDDYRLETAARVLLGATKLVAGPDRAREIERLAREDPARLAAYNLQDARLVLQILARTRLVELTVRRSLLTGMPLDRVGAQIAAVDFLYLQALRARGRVAPSVGARAAARSPGADAGVPPAAPDTPDGATPGPEAVEAITGGLVLEPAPGLYRHILVFDFKSLYPSLIRTFNIDPLTRLAPAEARRLPPAAVIRTPGGEAFRRDEPGILPELVARLAEERAQARAAGDVVRAQATKILMNSLFGVLGAETSRLFAPAVANAVTTAGQHVIRLAAAAVERLGYRVIYGDTDSLFVDPAEPDPERAAALAEPVRAAVGAEVAAALRREFGCESHLELEFEKLYRRFFLPEVRGGQVGSKKRYAGLVGDAVELVGLEAVRRDWSDVARRFQRELLSRVFRDEPVEDFIRDFVADLRAGRYDEELVYRKAVRKPLADYTRTTPPHVKAARKGGASPRGIVAYVVTRTGPEPVGATAAPPDYEHYVAHQLRPLADQLLRWLGGPDFDTLVGARRQLGLFD